MVVFLVNLKSVFKIIIQFGYLLGIQVLFCHINQGSLKRLKHLFNTVKEWYFEGFKVVQNNCKYSF